MYWNYRILKQGDSFQIHEVYYDSDTDKVLGCTEQGMKPFGETIEEVREDLKMMAAAFEKEVLNYDDIPDAEVADDTI
tara:strand:+ start:3297 stop:3530 length:234 start_codon:yes stop_codon:yes gene_type:complete